MLKLILIWIPILFVCPSNGQKGKDTPSALLKALERSKSDSTRIKLLFQLSDFYHTHFNQNKAHADSSLFYLQQALHTAVTINDTKWRHEALKRLGKYHFLNKNTGLGIESYLSIINELNKNGNKKEEVIVWQELSKLVPPRDTLGLTRLNCLEKIVSLYEDLGDREKEATALKEIADLRMNLNELDTAEAILLEVLQRYMTIKYPYLHYTYDLLTVTNRYQGDFSKAIYYGLKTIESMEATKDSAAATTFYSRLANIYRELGNTENSVNWYWKVFRDITYDGPVNLYMFRDAGFLTRELIKMNKKREALVFIREVANKNQPIGPYAKASLASTLAYCYHIQNQKDLAETYYRECINLTKLLEKDNEVTADVNYELGQYFLDNRQYAEASDYFQKALSVSPGINSLSTIKDIQLKLYFADSAQNNLLSAIKHLRKYQMMNDSIFNISKTREIHELQVQYETAQKEKDISILNNENQLQQIKVDQATRTKNIMLAGTALLAVIIVLLYNSYRIKQRSNRKLEAQQKSIEDQNSSLRRLVEEKEWLIKEIHHRVKNNLQIVMSLLNSQSAYIDNQHALTAIHDSQHRVHAMSLIHQKLYSTENVSSIDMSLYIRELTSYLADSFDMGQRIRFEYNIETLELDVSQAVPLGLILNEAITNSFKYAFPDGRNGVIAISLLTTTLPHYLLTISDNGIGIPRNVGNKKNGSLGISLMSGLSEDLDANFSIENNNGTIINISFMHNLNVKHHHVTTSSFLSNN